jgi:hypothetical protein
MYSRVGTVDWADHKTQVEWHALVNGILDDSIIWLDEAQIKAAKIPKEALERLTPEEIRDKIRRGPKNKRKDDVIDAVLSVLHDGDFISLADDDRIRKRLHNSPNISALLK